MDPIMLLIAVLAIAVGVGMLVQPAMYKKILDGYAARPSVRVVTSMLLVTAAFAMNQYATVGGLAGWVYYGFMVAFLVEGLMGLVIPETYRTFVQYFLKSINVHTWGLFLILLGGFLCWLVLM